MVGWKSLEATTPGRREFRIIGARLWREAKTNDDTEAFTPLTSVVCAKHGAKTRQRGEPGYGTVVYTAQQSGLMTHERGLWYW